MATRYLIGKGELLTQPIDAPRMKPSPKVRPYSVSEAQQLPNSQGPAGFDGFLTGWYEAAPSTPAWSPSLRAFPGGTGS